MTGPGEDDGSDEELMDAVQAALSLAQGAPA